MLTLRESSYNEWLLNLGACAGRELLSARASLRRASAAARRGGSTGRDAAAGFSYPDARSALPSLRSSAAELRPHGLEAWHGFAASLAPYRSTAKPRAPLSASLDLLGLGLPSTSTTYAHSAVNQGGPVPRRRSAYVDLDQPRLSSLNDVPRASLNPTSNSLQTASLQPSTRG